MSQVRSANEVWLEEWVAGSVTAARPQQQHDDASSFDPAPTPEFLGSFKSVNFTAVKTAKPAKPVSW